jgi:glucose-1-phosphate thymidylyltransferase
MMPIGAHDSTSAGETRPFLDYVLDGLASAGYRHVGIVIGPEHAAVRDRYVRDAVPQRLALTWIVQPEPRGTADAVLAAEAWAGTSPFVVTNGDNLCPFTALRALGGIGGPGLLVFEREDLARSGNIPAERLASFALARTNPDGLLTRIDEKPAAATLDAAGPRGFISMNYWRFDARIFPACRDVRPSRHGELELPAAVMLAMTRGVQFTAVPARGEVIDLSRRADVAQVSRRLAGRVPRF